MFTSLFEKAEQTRLPGEPAYDEARVLGRFTAWLDANTASPAPDPARRDRPRHSDVASGIFISYRREDAGPYARLLKEHLGGRLPGVPVFMDLDSIEAGTDF